MRKPTPRQGLGFVVSLVGVLSCKDSFHVGTSIPAGGHVGTSGIGTSGGGVGGGGSGGILSTAPATGGLPIGSGGAGSTPPDARATEPDGGPTDVPVSTPGVGGGSTGSGGATSTGGAAGLGGMIGAGGTIGASGPPGDGGPNGSGGAAGSVGALGISCTTDQDCPSGSNCCEGSDPSCDCTRLPAGDRANTGELVVSADGLTVADTITGLVWQRDGSGARASCSGEGKLRCAWSEAQAYCASLNLDGIARWRLPAWKELLGIADLTADGSASAIDPSAFPNTPAEGFWTSSPFAGSPSSMLYVDFANGSVGNCGDRSLRVRCVRGSTCHPTSRFVVLDDGLVHDTLTGLVWQQKPSVSALDGGPCMYWQEAEYTCASLGAGFRLPTLKEFESLVFPKGTSGPIIDKTAFPVTTLGSERFWTSSPYLGPNAGSTGYPPLNGPDAGSGYARYSAFSPAIFSSCDVSNGRNWGDFSLCFSVRCVR